MKKYLIWLGILLIILIIGMILGWSLFGRKQEPAPDVIVAKLQEQGFLITQSLVFNEPVNIEIKSGSLLRDFFWSQEVEGFGTIQVNMGIDLTLISEQDVSFVDDRIQVKIPNVEIFDSVLIGELQVQNKQGILKRLFDNDDGYNLVLEELTNNAKNAARQPEILNNAQNLASEQLKTFISLLAADKQIEIISQ